MSSEVPSGTPCRWSDVGEDCDNEATGIVKVTIGGAAAFALPTCDEHAPDDSSNDSKEEINE